MKQIRVILGKDKYERIEEIYKRARSKREEKREKRREQGKKKRRGEKREGRRGERERIIKWQERDRKDIESCGWAKESGGGRV